MCVLGGVAGALPKLLETNSDAVAVFVGDGHMRHYLEKQVCCFGLHDLSAWRKVTICVAQGLICQGLIWQGPICMPGMHACYECLVGMPDMFGVCVHAQAEQLQVSHAVRFADGVCLDSV